MGPFGEGPQQKIIDKMASLYEVFIKNFQRFQNSAATDPDVCQNLASSVSPPASIPPPSFPNLSPPQTSSSFPPSSDVPPPSFSNLSPPQSSSSFPPSSAVPPPSFSNLSSPQSSSSFPPSSAPPPLSSNLIPPTNSSSFSPPTSSYITPLPPASSYKTLPAPPPTSLTTTPTSSLSSPAVQCMTTDSGDSDLSSRECVIKGAKQKKWIYKQAECQVHSNQKTFPYDRIVKRRMSKEGVEEARVRWKAVFWMWDEMERLLGAIKSLFVKYSGL
uniref:Proline-rich receptor-like protein kinase PERK8 n=1 Tax=Danio rerio TaxID=7955 RepID=A0A0G2KU30_DANRE|nr:proline-rich receptor-like protein kinase PERK8 isoform X2 [Danio rerio]|eukprot:XP_021331247.1 proline-rich receptor-like protein kinase PERK8 isoform X2 [Danio rerio]